ncbi:hypothetical protein WME91_34800 [Sorangium sp. So ce269]
MSKRLRPGAVFAGRDLVTVTGAPVRVPDPAQLTHLQFRRFAGCPVCNVHLRSFARRHGEITAAGVCEVVLFHSPADELREHVIGLPFAVVADPDKRLYGEVGVESCSPPAPWARPSRSGLRSSVQDRLDAGRRRGGQFEGFGIVNTIASSSAPRLLMVQ